MKNFKTKQILTISVATIVVAVFCTSFIFVSCNTPSKASADTVKIHDTTVSKKTTENVETPKKKGIRVVISTFRGNNQRNYYGDKAPSKLDVIWTYNLGSGKSFAYGKMFTWSGAGWTGQPLVVEEDSATYLIQGAYDYHIRKINAKTGKEVWRYKFDDILKGTGTIWVNEKAENPDNKIVIMQGSRRGESNLNGNLRTSFRAVSYFTGKEVWRYNMEQTVSYSRDCDASAMTLGDTAYQILENGKFIVFSPDPTKAAQKSGILQPKVFQEFELWEKEDIQLHHNNLVNESSPTYMNGKIYITGGSGRIYAYNLATKKIDWQLMVGPDLDCSAPACDDSTLLVNFKPAYQCKIGGVIKVDPSKEPKDAIQWYFPVLNRKFAYWDGGIIGTVAINDSYIKKEDTHIAAFQAIDGNLYVIDTKNMSDKKATGPDGNEYRVPKLLYKYAVGAAISSPIIVGNKIVSCTYNGIFLFEFDKDMKFKLLDHKKDISCEASPIVWNNRIYIASNTTGLLYCFGEK